jgi:hypothetical protein
VALVPILGPAARFAGVLDVRPGLYLAMYPAVYVALMLLIRSRLCHVGVSHWLDGGVVGLTIAAVGAVLIFSTVLDTSTGRLSRWL